MKRLSPIPPKQWWRREVAENAPFWHHWNGGRGGSDFSFILSKIVANFSNFYCRRTLGVKKRLVGISLDYSAGHGQSASWGGDTYRPLCDFPLDLKPVQSLIVLGWWVLSSSKTSFQTDSDRVTSLPDLKRRWNGCMFDSNQHQNRRFLPVMT